MSILGKIDHMAGPDVDLAGYPFPDQIRHYIYCIKNKKRFFSATYYMARLLVFYLLGLFFSPISLLFKLSGFVFLSIKLDQVGDIQFLDGAIRRDRLIKNTPRWKFLVCRPLFTNGNEYALNLYANHVNFISNPMVRFLLAPFFINPFFNETIYSLDPCYCWHGRGAKRTNFYEIFNDYATKYKRPIVELDSGDRIIAISELRSIIPSDRPFVALHVRDSGHYGDVNRTTRNAKIETYIPAIRYLIEKGYTVVRMGHPSATSIVHLQNQCGPYLVDYAKSGFRSDLLDVYLMSECEFFLGTGSGLFALAIVFEKPWCLVNFYAISNALGVLPACITTFKKIVEVGTSTLLPLKDYLRSPFIQNPQFSTLKALGYDLLDNTEEEILDSVVEFLSEYGHPPSPLQCSAKVLIDESMYGYGAQGQFSNTILKQYFKSAHTN